MNYKYMLCAAKKCGIIKGYYFLKWRVKMKQIKIKISPDGRIEAET